MMRPLEEMQAEVLDSMPLLDEVEVGFADAIGAVLSRDVDAPDDLPGFENAAMDGFAVIAADTTNPPMDLTVAQRSLRLSAVGSGRCPGKNPLR